MHRLHYFHALVSVPRWNSDLSRRLALEGVEETYDHDPPRPTPTPQPTSG
jgi:hypothetical protein